MALAIKPRESCRWDAAALGEIMLRLDPGEGRIRTARSFHVWEGGGEYNVVRGLRRQYGSVDWVGPAQRQLLQQILLIRLRRHRRSSHQGQCDADAFVVCKEEKPVPKQRPAYTHAELIHS